MIQNGAELPLEDELSGANHADSLRSRCGTESTSSTDEMRADGPSSTPSRQHARPTVELSSADALMRDVLGLSETEALHFSGVPLSPSGVLSLGSLEGCQAAETVRKQPRRPAAPENSLARDVLGLAGEETLGLDAIELSPEGVLSLESLEGCEDLPPAEVDLLEAESRMEQESAAADLSQDVFELQEAEDATPPVTGSGSLHLMALDGWDTLPLSEDQASSFDSLQGLVDSTQRFDPLQELPVEAARLYAGQEGGLDSFSPTELSIKPATMVGEATGANSDLVIGAPIAFTPGETLPQLAATVQQLAQMILQLNQTVQHLTQTVELHFTQTTAWQASHAAPQAGPQPSAYGAGPQPSRTIPAPRPWYESVVESHQPNLNSLAPPEVEHRPAVRDAEPPARRPLPLDAGSAWEPAPKPNDALELDQRLEDFFEADHSSTDVEPAEDKSGRERVHKLSFAVLAALGNRSVKVEDLKIHAQADGTITLTGEVHSQYMKRSAATVASRVPGVTSVVNQLRIIDAPAEGADGVFKYWQQGGWLVKGLHLVAPVILVAIGWVYANYESLMRPAVYPVAGKILFDGKPADGANLVFHPANPDELAGGIPLPKIGATTAKDGTFVLGTFSRKDGAPAGKYKVTVEWRKLVGSGEDFALGPNLLPKRYSVPNTSGVEVEIQPQPNQLDPIDLSK